MKPTKTPAVYEVSRARKKKERALHPRPAGKVKKKHSGKGVGGGGGNEKCKKGAGVPSRVTKSIPRDTFRKKTRRH